MTTVSARMRVAPTFCHLNMVVESLSLCGAVDTVSFKKSWGCWVCKLQVNLYFLTRKQLSDLCAVFDSNYKIFKTRVCNFSFCLIKAFDHFVNFVLLRLHFLLSAGVFASILIFCSTQVFAGFVSFFQT